MQNPATADSIKEKYLKNNQKEIAMSDNFDFSHAKSCECFVCRNRRIANDYDYEMKATLLTKCGQLGRKHRMKRIHHSKAICIYPDCDGYY